MRIGDMDMEKVELDALADLLAKATTGVHDLMRGIAMNRDELRVIVANAIATEIERQDIGCLGPPSSELPSNLCWPYIDQGEVDFGLVADAALRAIAAQSD